MYDRIFGDFPAINVVYTPYIRMALANPSLLPTVPVATVMLFYVGFTSTTCSNLCCNFNAILCGLASTTGSPTCLKP